jgi:RNA methyltransferase, TrmH family
MISKAQIKRIASLQQKKYRGINNQFVVEGQKMVFEALNSGFKVVELFGLPGVLKSFSFSQKVEITVTDLNKISGFKTPPGVLAVVEIPNEKAKTFKLNTNKPNIYLENLGDPGNLGTIMRTADWFGIDQIFCSENTVDVYNPKVVQATMGSVFRVKISEVHLKDFISKCSENQIMAFGADMNGVDYQTIPKNKPIALVIGSEANGLSDDALKLLKYKISIPQKGSGESLNAAMASGILLSWFS